MYETVTRGIRIRVLAVQEASPGVDTREDLERVERQLAALEAQ